MNLRTTLYSTDRCERLRATRRALIGGALAFGALLALVSVARAGEPPQTAAALGATLGAEAIGRAALIDALAPVIASRGAAATVHVVPLDARRNLAPCTRMAGFIPPGARLVGKTLVGIRCAAGANWQTFLAADVRLEAPVWQTTRALRAGDALGAADLATAQALLTAADIDLAASGVRPGSTGSPRGLATLDARLPAPVGRIVLRPIAMGRTLTAADLREDGRINPGDAVRVVYVGDGFSVSSEGHSVGAADPGAIVSIRLASGALVNGTLRSDHRVELPR